MGRRERERSGGRLGRALVVLLVLAVGSGAVVSWQNGSAQEWWEHLRGGETPSDPAAVAAPAEIDAPPVVAPAPLAQPADEDGPLRRAAVKQALAGLGDPDLGRHVLAAVAPLEGTGMTYRVKGGSSVAIPASTTKVVTAAAALFLLGDDKVFDTTTVLNPAQGTRPARLVLVGGGDPFLARAPAPSSDTGAGPVSGTYNPERADVVTLARRTAKALKADGIRRVSFGYDASLFSGAAVNPRWESDYVSSGEVSPVSALWVDQGRQLDGTGRDLDPAAVAAQAFRAALVGAGIKVRGAALPGAADAAATPVAAVHSPRLAQIVQRILEVSDNDASEVLLRHIGLADQGVGSFEAGQDGVRRMLAANGIELGRSVLYDGSGLSRHNRLSPDVLIGVLRLAGSAEHPALRPLLAGLPVAGFTGSLAERMDQGPVAGLGRVRAKTGTLSHVSALAGIAVGQDGNLMAFVMLADRIAKPRTLLARTAMDNAAAALGACHCAP